MTHTLDHRDLQDPAEEPRVREVNLSRPFVWLRLGARDVVHLPRASLGFGGVVAAIGLLLMVVTWKATYVAPALLGGFLLVAPFLAINLYALSHQLEQGQAANTAEAWGAWRANADSIALFGLILALAYIFWERLAAIVFAFFYSGQALHLSRLPMELLLSGQYVGLLFAFVAAGAVLAAIVFALSVVSAPLLVDRPVDVITATLTSLRCCARNPGPMLLWAALIATLTAVGFATLMLGLIVIFPWLAYASWHAYRDLVEV
ncbi:DUF2189 domain-containing protein [Piscinibacter sp.]|jgi:uncharacterized membrane protein|uniref:DUF2189 domain-containing protein n=1 Tax=Piscinibacter sp. TaxID=1903157 RepID=UPI00355A22E5